MRLREQRLVEDQSSLSEYEKLAEEALDEDRYDSEADEESDRLEQSLKREKALQVRRKKEHREATEAHEN